MLMGQLTGISDLENTVNSLREDFSASFGSFDTKMGELKIDLSAIKTTNIVNANVTRAYYKEDLNLSLQRNRLLGNISNSLNQIVTYIKSTGNSQNLGITALPAAIERSNRNVVSKIDTTFNNSVRALMRSNNSMMSSVIENNNRELQRSMRQTNTSQPPNSGGNSYFNTGGLKGGILALLFSKLLDGAKFGANYVDSNYSTMHRKMASDTGIDVGGQSFKKWLDLRSSLQKNTVNKGILGDVSIYSGKEIDEALSKSLDMGVTLDKLTEATNELAFAQKTMPGLNIGEENYFKGMIRNMKDGAKGIRAVSVMIKKLTQDMWVTPEDLQSTVNKHHNFVMAMTRDIDSYSKKMADMLKVKAKLKDSGIGEDVEGIMNSTIENMVWKFAGSWDPATQFKFGMLKLDPKELHAALLGEGGSEEKAFDLVATKFKSYFSKYMGEDGTFKSTLGDYWKFEKLLNEAELMGFSGDEVKALLGASKQGGAFDNFLNNKKADEAIGGIQNSSDSVVAAAESGQEILEKNINLTFEQALSNKFDQTITELSKYGLLGDILQAVMDNGISLNSILTGVLALGVLKNVAVGAGKMTMAGAGAVWRGAKGLFNRGGRTVAGEAAGQVLAEGASVSSSGTSRFGNLKKYGKWGMLASAVGAGAGILMAPGSAEASLKVEGASDITSEKYQELYAKNGADSMFSAKNIGSLGGSLAGGALGGMLGTALGPVGTFFGSILGSMAGEYIGESLGETLDNTDIKGTLSGVESYFGDFSKSAVVSSTKFKDSVVNNFTYVKDKSSSLSDGIKSSILSLGDEFVSFKDKSMGLFDNLTNISISSIEESISGSYNEIKNWFSSNDFSFSTGSTFSFFENSWSSSLNSMKQLYSDFKDWLVNNPVSEGASSFFNGMLSYGKKVIGMGGGRPQDAPSSYRSAYASKFGSVQRPLFDSGYVSSGFGSRKDPFSSKQQFHSGTDYAMSEGSSIYAPSAGKIINRGNWGTYGLGLDLLLNSGEVVRLGHLSDNSQFSVGSYVNPGDLLAYSGNTGASTGPHLHMEVLKSGKNIDPEKWLNSSSSTKKGPVGGPREDLGMLAYKWFESHLGDEYILDGWNDCGGFTKRAYRDGAGLDTLIPHLADTQLQVCESDGWWSDNINDKNRLRIGDLIFTYTGSESGYKNISHIGMFDGSGSVINARGRAYGVVMQGLEDFIGGGKFIAYGRPYDATGLPDGNGGYIFQGKGGSSSKNDPLAKFKAAKNKVLQMMGDNKFLSFDIIKSIFDGSFSDGTKSSGGFTAVGSGEAESEIWNFLKGKGLSNIAVAAVMGNMAQESGLRVDAVNGSSGAYGLCQWLDSRYDGLVNYAAGMGLTPDNISAQLNWLWEELNSTESAGLSVLNSGLDLSQMTSEFCRKFERCGTEEANNSNRISEAYRILQKYGVGSYKKGIDYVPADEHLAFLHKGESVLTANEAEFWRGIKDNLKSRVTGVSSSLSNISSSVPTARTDYLSLLDRANVQKYAAIPEELSSMSVTEVIENSTSRLIEKFDELISVTKGNSVSEVPPDKNVPYLRDNNSTVGNQDIRNYIK